MQTYTFEALTDAELLEITKELFTFSNEAFDAMRAQFPHLTGKDIGQLRETAIEAAQVAVRYFDAYFASMKAQERRGIARYATYSED